MFRIGSTQYIQAKQQRPAPSTAPGQERHVRTADCAARADQSAHQGESRFGCPPGACSHGDSRLTAASHQEESAREVPHIAPPQPESYENVPAQEDPVIDPGFDRRRSGGPGDRILDNSPCGSAPSVALKEPMKAAVNRCYGAPDVVRVEAVERPVPADHGVLIKVHASSVNPLDLALPAGGALPHACRLRLGHAK